MAPHVPLSLKPSASELAQTQSKQSRGVVRESPSLNRNLAISPRYLSSGVTGTKIRESACSWAGDHWCAVAWESRQLLSELWDVATAESKQNCHTTNVLTPVVMPATF